MYVLGVYDRVFISNTVGMCIIVIINTHRYTDTHTHTDIYLYFYIFVCMCAQHASMLCKHIYAGLSNLINLINTYFNPPPPLPPPPPPTHTTHSLTIHFPYGLNELNSVIIWYTCESFNKIHVLKHSFSYLFFKIIISGKGKRVALLGQTGN